MAFPTSPSDGDIYTNAVGVTFEYDDGDDKWVIVAGEYVGDIYHSGYIHLYDSKASGGQSGTFTSGAWRTRVLTTEVTDIPEACSLSSNQFTLAAGTYIIFASAPAHRCNWHKAKLYNITDAADEIIGSSEYTNAGSDYAGTRSFVVGVFTIADTKVFELQHRNHTTKADIGFGLDSTFGVDERYADVQLWKVA